MSQSKLKVERHQDSFDILLRDESGPRFTFRYLNGREFLVVADLFDSVAQSRSARVAVETMLKLLRSCAVSWDNVRSNNPAILKELATTTSHIVPALSEVTGSPTQLIPFRPDLLDLVLDLRHIQPMVETVMREQNPAVADLGNSSLPASSQPATSAPIASLASDAATSDKALRRSTLAASDARPATAGNQTETFAPTAAAAAAG